MVWCVHIEGILLKLMHFQEISIMKILTLVRLPTELWTADLTSAYLWFYQYVLNTYFLLSNGRSSHASVVKAVDFHPANQGLSPAVKHTCHWQRLPRAGSRVERIDLLHFLVGCHKNQALSVLSLSLVFECVCCSVNLGPLLHCVICVFCGLVVLVRLSVPVQVIDWKDSSPKWPVMCWWGR